MPWIVLRSIPYLSDVGVSEKSPEAVASWAPIRTPFCFSSRPPVLVKVLAAVVIVLGNRQQLAGYKL